MQNIVERARKKGVSPYTVELLTHERNKGRSLRRLGQMFDISHEWVRQILSKYSTSLVTLFPESAVAVKLGYPVKWLVTLRTEGIINPTKPGGQWLYTEEQVRQIPSIVAKIRRCELCGKPRPKGYQRFCRECSQYRKKHRYSSSSSEEKAEHREKSLAWRKANPERWKKISSRAQRKYRGKRELIKFQKIPV